MVSRIAESVPNEFLSIEHLGMYDKGVEDYESEHVKPWAGSIESYTLTETNGITTLAILMEVQESEANKPMLEMFAEMWPKALAKVKELAEA